MWNEDHVGIRISKNFMNFHRIYKFYADLIEV